MSKRKNNTSILKRENIIRRLRIFLIAVLVIILFYPPYLQGLFFEKHVLPTEIIVFITFIIFLVYKWLKNDSGFFKTPIEYACFGFVIVYFISIFVAVHTRSAIIEWLKYCMYFAVFYMVSDLAEDCKTKLLFIWTVIISAAGVAIIGLDAALGGNLVKVLNGLYNLLGGQGNLFFGLFVGNRIHSTLQYPNALASYLMAVFFITVGLIMFSKKWWQRIILGSITFTLFLTFMLTQSRGAQLLFPVAVVILLIVAPNGKRIKVITYTLFLALPAVLISLLISAYLSEDTININALLLVIVGLIITSVISLLVEFIGEVLQRVNWKIYILIASVLLISVIIGVSYIINISIPAELSLLESEEDKYLSLSKDVSLEPSKKYILRFEAEGKMIGEKPYSFVVILYNKNLSNILFGGSERLVRQEFAPTNGYEKFDILFNTKEDTKLVNINFIVYYARTYTKIKGASIIDAETGDIVKNLKLKNKYNLENIISRFQNILLQRSLLTRIILYKDGFNIFKDRWLLGAGGGAWNYLYRRYQSYNYTSNQAHNYPLQLSIETGILGIVVLVYLVITLVVSYKRYYRKDKNDFIFVLVFTAIASLFLHSVIDFDFSESSLLLLFWTLIALFNRQLKEKLEPGELFLLINKACDKKNPVNRKSKYAILAGTVITVITLYFSFTFFAASCYAKQSFVSLQNNDIEDAIYNIEKAIKLDKYNELYVIGFNPIPTRQDIRTGLIDILFLKNDAYNKIENEGGTVSEKDINIFKTQFTKAVSYLKRIEKKANNNLSLFNSLVNFYIRTGEIDKGIGYIDKAIECYPFSPSIWQAKVSIYYQLMSDYYNRGDYDRAKEYLLKGLNVIDEAKEVNKRNMNPFVFNDDTVAMLQNMRYMLDYWGTDEIYYVNEIIHYSIFDLDVNMDGVPDQWKVNNKELLQVSIREENKLEIHASDKSFLNSQYPITFSKGGKYKLEIRTQNDLDYLYCYLVGHTLPALPLNKEDGKYATEFIINDEPKLDSNELLLYFKSDCVIDSILVKKIE